MDFQGEFSFSPKSLQYAYKSLTSLRSVDDSNLNSPRNILEHLQLKQERHEALKNYYEKIIGQLNDFLKMSLYQLSDQRTLLIEEIDEKYREAVKEVKTRVLKKEQELIEKLAEAEVHYEEVSGIIKRVERGADEDLLREAEENLKLWASEVEASTGNISFPVPSLTMPTSQCMDYQSLGKHLKISSILSEHSPLHMQSTDKIKLLVPFIDPPYSFYYFLEVSQIPTTRSLLTCLKSYFNLPSLFLSYSPLKKFLPDNEKIPVSTHIYLHLPE